MCVVILYLRSTHAQPGEPLSVAEVINHPTKYDGQRVTLTGSLNASFEFTALSGTGCEVHLTSTRPPLACAVSLDLPDCGNPDSVCSGDLKDLTQRIRLVRFSRKSSTKQMVLIGKLEFAPKVFVDYKRPLDIPGLPKGEYVQTGFDHMNAFPAQLLVVEAHVPPQ
jgi:hypothetical protein